MKVYNYQVCLFSSTFPPKDFSLFLKLPIWISWNSNIYLRLTYILFFEFPLTKKVVHTCIFFLSTFYITFKIPYRSWNYFFLSSRLNWLYALVSVLPISICLFYLFLSLLRNWEGVGLKFTLYCHIFVVKDYPTLIH